MIAIQLFGLVIGLSAVYFSHLYYKKAEFNKAEFIFWLAVWIGFIIVSVFPQITAPLTTYLHLSRPMDLVMILSFIFLFSLSFRNYISTKKQGRWIEKIVRELSMKGAKKKFDI